ncbi:hypothetical protein [Streptomyces syringium]|uniref:hypothetical protein n=1 Tax=Streptomyces syringium TaxID=76729 RepID=UPI00344431F1
MGVTEKHPADAERTRSAFVVTPSGSAALPVPEPPQGDVTANALTPAHDPGVYLTPQFRRALRDAVDARLDELRQATKEAAEILAATERLEAVVLRTHVTP